MFKRVFLTLILALLFIVPDAFAGFWGKYSGFGEWFDANKIAVFGVSYGLASDIVGRTPKLKANSIVGAVLNVLAAMVGSNKRSL